MDVGREDMRSCGVRVETGDSLKNAEEADLFLQVPQLSTNDQTAKASQQDGQVRTAENEVRDQETTEGKLGT